jgi:cell division protein FtsL
MASVATALPRPLTARPKLRRNLPVSGRAGTTEVRFVKRINNSRLRREVDRSKQRECYRLLALLVLVFAFAFAYAWQHFQCVRLGYEIQSLKEQRAAMQQLNRQLRLEQASLADPQRIDLLAQGQGLAAPTPRQVIQVGQVPPAASSTEFAGNVLEPAPAAEPDSVPGSHRKSSSKEQ